jgi:hypothetical protein
VSGRPKSFLEVPTELIFYQERSSRYTDVRKLKSYFVDKYSQTAFRTFPKYETQLLYLLPLFILDQFLHSEASEFDEQMLPGLLNSIS